MLRPFLWFLVILFGLVLIYKWQTVEGFNTGLEPTVQSLTTELSGAMTLASETICPALLEVINRKTQEIQEQQQLRTDNFTDISNVEQINPLQPTLDPETRKRVVKDLQLEAARVINPLASGEAKILFVCPPPTDPMKISNSIDKSILATCTILLKRLDPMIEDIQKSLSCKKEGFADSDTPKTDTEKTANTENNASTISALQVKLSALQKAMLNPVFTDVSIKYKKLMDLKRKAESGEMSTNCSKP